MNVVAQAFALLAALIHVMVGILEAFFYDRSAVRVFLTGSADDAPEVQLWRFFAGIYNILLGLGILAGLAALRLDEQTVGRTLITYVCSFMVASGVIFLVTTPRLWRGALGQLVPAGIALLAAFM
jgi:putative membrane protein